MDSKERFRGFKQPESPEDYLGVKLWDLRKSREARRRGVEPGYYFTFGPVGQDLLQSGSLLNRLSPYLLDVLFQENIIGERAENIAGLRQS